ncbi:HNH endonuclease [Roseibium alexandrii]|uniref:HNH endonuclease n=1 Tax=Roseibium alexandrii TaxID=388408 RepID=UPI0037530EE4
MIDNPLGGRSVEEWVGKHPDSKVPSKVRDRVFQRYKGRCYLSGMIIRVGDKWELHHKKALGLGGEHRESNLVPVLPDPHKEETAEQVGMISKADRIRMKHNGTWPSSQAKIRSRGFPKTRDV